MNQTITTVVCAILLWLPLPALAAAPAATEAPPPVTRVVIYPDRALVTRALEAACTEAPSTVVFRSLPTDLDPTTLRAAAEGSGARVDGVSLSVRTFADAQLAQVRELDDKLEALGLRVTQEERARDRAAGARAQAESLRGSMPAFLVREIAAEKKPNTSAWAAGLDLARGAVEEADARRRTAEIALRELERQRSELQERRDALSSAAPRAVSDAEVVVRCTARGSTRVELSYMAGGTTWEPVYEARTTEGKDALELTVLAQVQQATGEAWKAVEVVLSTATTRRDARPPEPLPLRLGATVQEQAKKVLVRHEEDVRHLENTRTTSVVAATPPPSAPEPPMAAADQGLSVQLKVPGKVDLAGDGRPTRLKVETLRLPATYSLLCVPKQLPYAFRAVEAVNQARYPLPPGRVDLFNADSFLGSARLPLVAQHDQVKLAFGIDESVKIRRVTLEEDKRDPGFLGSTRRMLYGYKVEVANFAARPVTVNVQDHLPVSQLEDVKVVIDERTTRGYQVAKEDGIVTWKLPLAAKERKDLELRFVVEIPSKYDAGGL